jgi:hypothetical protein
MKNQHWHIIGAARVGWAKPSGRAEGATEGKLRVPTNCPQIQCRPALIAVTDVGTARSAPLPTLQRYIVEVDGNKIPFPATEGEVLEVKPQ